MSSLFRLSLLAERELVGEGRHLLAGLADERFGVVFSGERRGRQRGRRACRRRPYSTCRLAVLPSRRLARAHNGNVRRGAAGAHPARLNGAAVDVERRFLVLGGASRAQVVGRLETLPPGGAVEIAQDATGGLGDVEVEG